MNYYEIVREMSNAARSTGQFILEQKDQVTADDIETKSLNSLVSYVDITAEQQLVESLGQIVPEAGFITEEETSTQRGDRFNWIIDPLDGTTNFLHGIPPFAVSIALQEHHEIKAGVIYELTQNELFSAAKGLGAYLNGKSIRCSSQRKLSESLIATGFPYENFAQMPQYMALLQKILGETRGLRRLGSAATDMAYVACGRFNAFFEYGLSAWDVAAGAIIVSEAGGLVKDFKGEDDYLYNGELVCGSAGTFSEMAALIQEYLV